MLYDGAGTQAISQAVTGSIQNSGSLTKQGTGTWTLDEELNAPISTSVLAGVLVVDSTLNTPLVNVQAWRVACRLRDHHRLGHKFRHC